MEVFTIVLSTVLGLISPIGLVTEQIATHTIRKQLKSVEQLHIRLDNTPSHQLIQGKIDRVRLAGHGLEPITGLRIDTLEIETDAVNLNRQRLQKGNVHWQEPLQAGVRLVLKGEDIQKALQSPSVIRQLQKLVKQMGGDQLQGYNLQAAEMELLDNQRLRFQAKLQGQTATDHLAIQLETGIKLLAGHQFELLEPVIILNQTPLPAPLAHALSRRIADRLDLRTLEESGLLVRILQWQMNRDRIELAAFVQVQRTSP